MPTYEYECSACGHRFEKFQSMSEKPIRQCSACGKPEAERIIHGGAGVLFKGSGFYQTDYRSKSYKESSKKDKPVTPPCSGDCKSCPATQK